MRRLAPLLLCSTLFILNAHAQSRVEVEEPSMWLAGVMMRLGMSREAIVTSLPEPYILMPTDDTKNNYSIVERQRDREGRYVTLGNISFQQDRLVLAAKEWYDNRSPSDLHLAEALYAAMSEMEKRGETFLNMRTRTTRQPSLLLQVITLSYDKREVTISEFEFKGSRGVQVTERMSSVKER